MNDSTLPRLGLNDFLGTLPGGFYTLLAIYSVSDGIPVNDWDTGRVLLATVVVFMASFLIGSLYRAIRVDLIALERLFFALGRSKSLFPYADQIQRCLCAIKKQSLVKNVPEIEIDTTDPKGESRAEAVMVFDFWKAVICQKSPHAFAHIKSLEAKVRFFASMVVAGVVVVAIECNAFARALPKESNSWSYGYATLAAGVLLVSCLWALRRARREEVSEVVWAYVTVSQE